MKEYREPTTRPDGKVALSDLYGSAYLVAVGHHVVGIEPNGRRVAFLFKESNNLHADYLRFLNNVPVGSQDFTSAVYRLKRLLKTA